MDLRFTALLTVLLLATGCELLGRSAPPPPAEVVDEDPAAPADAADPGDPQAPVSCSVGFGDPEIDLPATVDLGDFAIEVTAHGGLDVTHADSGARSLFAAPAGASWLTLGRADLEVREHQGSFAVDEGLHELCSDLELYEARQAAGGLHLYGGFVDCPGADFEARFCEAAPGHLGFEVEPLLTGWNLVVLRTASSWGERIYGMGEQAPHHSLDLKGREIPVLAQEGGVGRGHMPITPAVDAISSGSGGSEDSTYYAAPHYLTSEHRSLFLENSEYQVFDFRQDEAIEIRLHARSMRGRILQGGSILELVERFTDYAGRMPALPGWVGEGAIVALARPLDETLEIVDRLLEHDAAISGVWNQTWSGVAETYIGEQVLWNWVQNPHHHPGWGDWADVLADRDVRVLCYVNSMFRELPDDAGPVTRDLFREGVEAGHFVRDEHGETLMMPVTAFDVALLDLTDEAARAWMKEVIGKEMMEEARCSGWMADFAEALPFEAVMADGRSGAEFHNLYPVEWARLNREAVEEAGRMGDVLVFNRSGFTTSPRHSMLLWQGDQLTTWDRYDGLSSAVHSLISGGFSGIALNHSDIGGYTSLSWMGLGYTREAELLKRWTEMAAFTAVMRTHEGNQPGSNAQVYSDDEAMAHFARMTRVYRALAPVREQLFVDASARGWPMVRHLAMHHGQDPEAWDIDDQFLLGDELLVAPIVQKCGWSCPPEREVWLPAGEWTHLWSGEVFGDIEVSTVVTVEAPLGEPPVFFPLGSELGSALVDRLLAEDIDAGGATPLSGFDPIGCGDTVSGDTAGALASASFDAYGCNVGDYSAPERAFALDPGFSGPASFALVDPTPTEVDHDVMVMDITGGAADCVTWGGNSATFEAEAGRSYLLVVDGYHADAGAFEARLTCAD